MEIWITREQTGILVDEFLTVDEIEKGIKTLEVYKEFSPKEEVKVEFTGRWEQIKQFFQDIRFLANAVMETDYAKGSAKDQVIERLHKNNIV